jgi:hypothetical protein
MTILVFPSCIEAAVRFADEAHQWGQRVIGASSLDADPYASRYDAWEKLPFINEEGFFPALKELVRRQSIESIFTPHAPTFNLFEAKLRFQIPDVAIRGEGPYRIQVAEMEKALEQAERDLQVIAGFGIEGPSLPVESVAGMLLQMDRLYGQCSREKALAVSAIMPSAEEGDVVEIGSLFGKSTYIFNRLASYYRIGGTLAVDPWNLETAIQSDAPLNIQDAPRKWNWEMVRRGFLVNMMGCSCPPFNYMRATSEAAYARYSTNPKITTAEFGTTTFTGSISVLHIDGNHDELSVARDFDTWSKSLGSSAWIVFDDYHWPHGDGPRKVADRVVGDLGARAQERFVAGGALFLRVGPP